MILTVYYDTKIPSHAAIRRMLMFSSKVFWECFLRCEETLIKKYSNSTNMLKEIMFILTEHLLIRAPTHIALQKGQHAFPVWLGAFGLNISFVAIILNRHIAIG